MRFSYTDLALYNRCRFSYQAQKMWMWPSASNQPQALGDMVHVGLAASMTNRSFTEAIDTCYNIHYRNSSDIPAEDSIAAKTNAHRLTFDTVRWLKQGGWTPLAFRNNTNGRWVNMVEVPVSMPLADGDEFHGIVDLVATEESSGQVWLFDYKVRSTIEAEINEDYNLQMAIYQYMLQAMGIPVVGSVCLQIRSTPLQWPKVNKDGSLSRADLVCDWPTYASAVIANGLKVADYEDMRLKLGGKQFITASRSYRSSELLQEIWATIVLPLVDDIKWLKSIGSSYIAPRNMNAMCKLCNISERCQNHLRGLDETQFTIEFQEGE